MSTPLKSPKDPSEQFREERDRDLGFGSVVSERARQRLLNRDGSFNVARHGLGLRSKLSLYHSLLTMTWTRFVGLCAALFFALNLAFAGAYVGAGPGAISGTANELPERAWDAFFFSVQTFSTVGYGELYPQSRAANLIMSFQALVGLLAVALVTGVVFARFSRPLADIIFSRNAIVAPFHDGTAFMFRIANRRRNQIVHLGARIILALRDSSQSTSRTYHELSLERSRVYFFPLHWTIVHPIDESSPLYGIGRKRLIELEAEFLVLLTGFDETFSQEVHTRSSYAAHEVVWNVKFESIFESTSGEQPVTIDLGRLHDFTPVESG